MTASWLESAWRRSNRHRVRLNQLGFEFDQQLRTIGDPPLSFGRWTIPSSTRPFSLCSCRGDLLDVVWLSRDLAGTPIVAGLAASFAGKDAIVLSRSRLWLAQRAGDGDRGRNLVGGVSLVGAILSPSPQGYLDPTSPDLTGLDRTHDQRAHDGAGASVRSAKPSRRQGGRRGGNGRRSQRPSHSRARGRQRRDRGRLRVPGDGGRHRPRSDSRDSYCSSHAYWPLRGEGYNMGRGRMDGSGDHLAIMLIDALTRESFTSYPTRLSGSCSWGSPSPPRRPPSSAAAASPRDRHPLSPPPGLDDGPRTNGDAIELVHRLDDDGIGRVPARPLLTDVPYAPEDAVRCSRNSESSSPGSAFHGARAGGRIGPARHSVAAGRDHPPEHLGRFVLVEALPETPAAALETCFVRLEEAGLSRSSRTLSARRTSDATSPRGRHRRLGRTSRSSRRACWAAGLAARLRPRGSSSRRHRSTAGQPRRRRPPARRICGRRLSSSLRASVVTSSES